MQHVQKTQIGFWDAFKSAILPGPTLAQKLYREADEKLTGLEEKFSKRHSEEEPAEWKPSPE